MVGRMEWPLVGREAELAHSLSLIESGRGVALLGDAGVGKSRLLHELTNRVESSGVPVFRGIATESTRSVPFAPFVPILPEGSTEDRTDLLRRVLATVGEMAGSRGLLIAVDDAHHLDDGSLALLATVVSRGAATVCLTARSGETMKADLVDLWTNGAIERLEIGPLDETQTSVLIKSTLGEVQSGLLTRLWEVTRGNPLVLHEVVEGSVGRAITPDEGDVWRLEGSLEESPRLADLVRARTDQIPGDLRHALELVSVGAPLPLTVLEKAVDVDPSVLEATQLVSVERSGDAWVAVPAHPLHGEVLVANLGEAHKRRLHRELLEAAIDLEGAVDDLQLAVWQRAGGTIEHPDTAVKGALVALARHDPTLAEELIRPVIGSSTHAGVILGRALNFQHRFEEGEQVLAGVDTNDPRIVAELASARAHNLGFGLGRVSEAVEILDGAAASVEDDDRARLDVERAMIWAIRGDFTAAVEAGRAVVANAAATPAARASGYVSLALSLAMTADCDGFEEIIGDAYGSAEIAKADVPLAEDQIGCMELCALCAAGRPDQAVAVGHRFKNRSTGSGLYAFWLDALAIAHDLSGQQRDGLESALAAKELMHESDPFGLQLQAQGLAALERGQLGDPGGRDDVEGIEFDLPDPRLSIWVDRGRVWSRVADGEVVDEVAESAAAGGRQAIEAQHYSWGAPAAHDAVRLGRPELVVDELSQLRNEKGAHLLNTMADHAESMTAGDGRALVDVAKAFASVGVWLLAAETAAQAATRLDHGEAAAAVCLSMGWELRCQDPHTPALAARPGLVSEREFEIAMKAAKGHTSPEISRDLYISVRTVDNHLRSVYRKLDVGGRDELAEILSPLL
jgi:DNA-binding CsgD family transcriptional regulator